MGQSCSSKLSIKYKTVEKPKKPARYNPFHLIIREDEKKYFEKYITDDKKDPTIKPVLSGIFTEYAKMCMMEIHLLLL
jgi:hypothetical protein